MATLIHVQSCTEHQLAARHGVGRSRMCELRLDLNSVSVTHAEIRWDGQVWHLRDLGSLNGTFVDGHRLGSGQEIVLEPGMQIGFGAPSLDYRFADASPPQAMAFAPDCVVVARDGVLRLPPTDDPEMMILCDASSRWIVEGRDDSRPVDDEEILVVGGTPYRVRLPGSTAATRRGDLPDGDVNGGCLQLTLSHDAEHIELRYLRGGRTYQLESRAHAPLLLELARARIRDAANESLPDTEYGWMHRDDLLRDLGIDDPQLLNLWVYRARRQFGPLNLDAIVIERRQSAGQLRIGIPDLQIIER